MKKIILSLLIFLLPILASASDIRVMATERAESYSYVRESTNRNDGPEINMFLNHVGLPKGSPYCMSFVSYCYYLAAQDMKIKSPIPKFGAVNQFYYYAEKNPVKYKILKNIRLSLGIEKGSIGDILIFKRGSLEQTGDSFKGHTGLLIKQINNNKFETIEGNTSGSDTGDQRGEGKNKGGKKDGVYYKTRGLSLGTNFPLVGFVRVK